MYGGPEAPAGPAGPVAFQEMRVSVGRQAVPASTIRMLPLPVVTHAYNTGSAAYAASGASRSTNRERPRTRRTQVTFMRERFLSDRSGSQGIYLRAGGTASCAARHCFRLNAAS